MADLVFNFTTGHCHHIMADQQRAVWDIMSHGHMRQICNEYNMLWSPLGHYQANILLSGIILWSLYYDSLALSASFSSYHYIHCTVNTDSLSCCDRRVVVVVVS